MRFPLTLHPDSRCEAVQEIEVDLARMSAGSLSLRYLVLGLINELHVPAPTIAARTNGLWQHTCFEAFVRQDAGYAEFNLSPSGEWSAYSFAAYRSGMRDLAVDAPRIETLLEPGRLELRAELPLAEAATHLGLSAVIEEAGGRKSYWALAHPAAKPDFHHPDSFICELPPFSSPRT